jgi:hypothetical protein
MITEGNFDEFIRLIEIFSPSDLVATAKNVYTGMITAGSKANQTHKIVEVRINISI